MKILVIHPGSLGDVILSLPALRALRQAYPMACLEMMGSPSILELLQGRFYADRIISIDRGDVSSCLTGQADPSEPLVCTFRGYTFVVNWLADKDGEFSYRLRQIGVKKIFASRPISKKTNHQHRTKIFLEALAPLGIPIPFTEPRLFPSDEDRRLAQEALLRSGILFKERPVFSEPVLAIHVGSGGPAKCWDLSRFVKVSRQAQEYLGFRPLFILGPAERALAPRLKTLLILKQRAEASVGKGRLHPAVPVEGDGRSPIIDCLPLPVLAGALTWCSGFLGNDSGVTHLAAALGIPTVAIFGPTDPDLWGPVGQKVTILSKRTKGRHAGDRICQGCSCLDLVSVEEVMQALAKI